MLEIHKHREWMFQVLLQAVVFGSLYNMKMALVGRMGVRMLISML